MKTTKKLKRVKVDKSTVSLREQWLQPGADKFRTDWKRADVAVPAVQISCSFPGGGSPLRRIGECWPRAMTKGKVNEIYINPILFDPLEALDTLGHELLHAVDDCKSKHGRVFTVNSQKVGYSGGKHSHAKTPEAKALIARISKELGAYPHKGVIMPTRKHKPKNGLHKFSCEECGDVLYSTMKTYEDKGAPCCRECGEEMEPHDREDKKVIRKL